MESKELMTKRRIEALAAQYESYDDFDLHEFNYKDSDSIEVFVSHSSSDNVFIRKVLLFLKYAKGGIRSYVDWQDPLLPSKTDARTALRLKDRIRRARKVIYVVTTDSLKSVWCSWEIGFADRDKGTQDIAILAVKPNNGRWKENEYLQLYPWISYDKNQQLFKVHDNKGNSIELREWISQ